MFLISIFVHHHQYQEQLDLLYSATLEEVKLYLQWWDLGVLPIMDFTKG